MRLGGSQSLGEGPAPGAVVATISGYRESVFFRLVIGIAKPARNVLRYQRSCELAFQAGSSLRAASRNATGKPTASCT
jgi:hypothetical protein